MIRMLPLIILGLGCASAAAKYPFQVFNPSETKVPAEDHQIYPHVKTLITHLEGRKKSTFIDSKGEGNPLLFWSIETLTIVSPDLVAVDFSEGHISVIGVYLRDHQKKRWDLVAEVRGTFAERGYMDPAEPEAP